MRPTLHEADSGFAVRGAHQIDAHPLCRIVRNGASRAKGFVVWMSINR
jgi:hypothetical protein